VVIVNYRTKELTRDSVASVLTEPEVQEVVVVDNASGDGSAPFLRDAFVDSRVHVLESPRNGGFAYAVNRGATVCGAPLLLVLNSDATVSPGCLGLLAETLLLDETIGVAAPAVYRPGGRTLEPRTFGMLPKRHDIVLRVLRNSSNDMATTQPEWVSGVAMLMRRQVFVDAGGFDEAFEMYFEDMDLCRRLCAQGLIVRRVPVATVIHAGGGSWRSSADKRRRFQESKALYFEKIGALPLELQCIRALGAVRIAAAELAEARGRRRSGRAPPAR
jgi:N-acetylglucosaminyl-diphospho-decaprenol L-rhamnosyltransferase